MKQVNMEWMQDLLNEEGKKEFINDLPTIDWVQNGKSFKKELKFKIIPANSKENNIFAAIVSTHWNLGPNKDKRFICTETTSHLKKLNIVCPVCETKRQLLAKGFTEDDLSTAGKFGPVPVFDPTITSNVKVVVIDTDMKKDWDQAHISILQQKGSFLTRWLIEKYMDSETPDFLSWEMSNTLKFSRQTDNGKWDREISFSTYNPTPEVLAKLKEENETLCLMDIWRQPNDQEILETKQLVEDMKNVYVEAKNTMTSSAKINDDVPF